MASSPAVTRPRTQPWPSPAKELPVPSAGWGTRIGLLGLLLGMTIAAFSGLALGVGRLMPSEGELLYYSSRDGDMNIYLADLASGREFALTRDPADDLWPDWSPDGQQIAFMSYRDGNAEIYVMDALGRNPRRLTDNNFNDSAPVWSPDGEYIAFESYRGVTQDIYLLEVATGDERPLTRREGQYSLHPAWSPDGATLAFYADDRRDPELFTIGVAGQGLQRLTQNTVNDWDPVWSPDGQWLAYYTNAQSNLDIFVLNVATGEEIQVTYHLARDWLPTWSPDGSQLAFISERTGTPALYAIDTACLRSEIGCADSVHLLSSADPGNERPVWSPLGTQMAFVSPRDGNIEIYVANLGCTAAPGGCSVTNARRITQNDSRDRGPVWRP